MKTEAREREREREREIRNPDLQSGKVGGQVRQDW